MKNTENNKQKPFSNQGIRVIEDNSAVAPIPPVNAIQAYGQEDGVIKSLTSMPFRPRNIEEGYKALMQEAALLGPKAFYTWPVKNKKTGKVTIIEGASVHLLMAAARHFRNLRFMVRMEKETESAWHLLGVAQDLESGLEIVRPHIAFKPFSKSPFENQRDQYAAFQIGVSKAIRNVLANIIPSYWLADGIEKAKKAGKRAAGGSRKISKKQRIDTINAFKDKGVPEEVLNALVQKDSKDWTGQDLSLLRAEFAALLSGDLNVEAIYALAGMEYHVEAPQAPIAEGKAAPNDRSKQINNRAAAEKTKRALLKMGIKDGITPKVMLEELKDFDVNLANLNDKEVKNLFGAIKTRLAG